MEPITLYQNIEVVYLTVPNFPNDVKATYDKLLSCIAMDRERRYFGISHPDSTGKIIYKAAAEVLPNDNFAHSDLQKFTIKKGQYASEYIVNHFRDENCIGEAFQRLLKHPALDPMGYCLEVYKNFSDLDVQCMVPILEQP